MKKIFILSIAIIAMAACSKEQATQAPSDEIRFAVSHPSAGTRATSSAFEADDAVSLYAVEYEGDTQMPLQLGGNYLNNERLRFNGTSWSAGRTLYWSNSACDFYALYPYQSNINFIERHPFSLALNQNGAGYDNSDLMFASAVKVTRAGGPVALDFKHMLSKVVVRLVKGPQFEGEIPDDVVTHIYNTHVDCYINFTTGSIEKDAFGAKRTITMKKISNQEFEAVVVPQNIEKRTPLIEVTMGGIAYLLEYSMAFRPGYKHTINLTLNTSPDQEQIEISIDTGYGGWN